MTVTSHEIGGLAALIAPMEPAEFEARIKGRSAHHFPGPDDRFRGVLDWVGLEHLLAMTHLWSDATMNIVLDGRVIAPQEYCTQGHGREGSPLLVPDMVRVDALIGRGATLVLDRVETLIPGLLPLTRALQSAFGASVVCNVYCSWKAHQGFISHYDTTDVLAIQLCGNKRWRIYGGRAPNPVPRPGHQFSDQPPEHHARAKGALAQELEMTPGDVLYLPRGQYHDALASSEASLHLSFGITRPTGLDFMSVLAQSLPDESLMREEFPHFDDMAATRDYLRRLAGRTAELIADPALAKQAVDWQRQRVFRDRASALQLPQRRLGRWVRMRHVTSSLAAMGDGVRVTLKGGPTIVLDAAECVAFNWMRRAEVFLVSELVDVTGLDESSTHALLDRLSGAGLVEPL